MNRQLKLIISALVLANALVISCAKKQSQSVTPGYTAVSFQASTPSSSSALTKSALLAANLNLPVKNRAGEVVGHLNLSEAVVAIKQVKLKTEDELDENESEEKYHYKDPFIVDLIQETITPSLPEIKVGAGRYCEIEMKLHRFNEDAADERMRKRSIYLKGTYTGRAASGDVSNVPFTLSFETDEEFKLRDTSRSCQGFNISDTVGNRVIIAFRMAKWFSFDMSDINDKAAEFSDVEVKNGKINLDHDSSGMNKKVWEVIRHALKKSADFGKDDNEDGKLESSEDDDQTEDDSRDE